MSAYIVCRIVGVSDGGFVEDSHACKSRFAICANHNSDGRLLHRMYVPSSLRCSLKRSTVSTERIARRFHTFVIASGQWSAQERGRPTRSCRGGSRGRPRTLAAGPFATGHLAKLFRGKEVD